jgi:hypothetical protein
MEEKVAKDRLAKASSKRAPGAGSDPPAGPPPETPSRGTFLGVKLDPSLFPSDATNVRSATSTPNDLPPPSYDPVDTSEIDKGWPSAPPEPKPFFRIISVGKEGARISLDPSPLGPPQLQLEPRQPQDGFLELLNSSKARPRGFATTGALLETLNVVLIANDVAQAPEGEKLKTGAKDVGIWGAWRFAPRPTFLIDLSLNLESDNAAQNERNAEIRRQAAEAARKEREQKDAEYEDSLRSAPGNDALWQVTTNPFAHWVQENLL